MRVVAVLWIVLAIGPAAHAHHEARLQMTRIAKDAAPPRHTNRLAHETSPYLLQHAHNPVDWHPWGEEAFELARRTDRPIFLSIGYSTCYWCHVMERESFEDEAVAAVMNERYVCIKVDREERPDVDEAYMTACQVFTQLTEGRASGGWPLSAFLEPRSLEPFYVGTYFPPRAAFGRPSFVQVLASLSRAWTEQRADVEEQAERLAGMVRRQLAQRPPARAVDGGTVDQAVNGLMAMHDREWGGFGSAPKFPQPVFLELLVEAAWDRPAVRDAVLRTADRMAQGGMHDQVGGGFHRYSVDARWVVPHFEKMLYDNGQLASLYAELAERTGDAHYRDVLRGILDWAEREMLVAEGAFASAQDAEVDAREGGNYVWTAEEVVEALEARGDAALADTAVAAFGLDAGPNFRDPHHPDAAAVNVLVLADRPAALAQRLGIDEAALRARLDSLRTALLEARQARPQPATDDKVLAGWNGLMIGGFADGGRVLGEPALLDVARRAAGTVLATMRDGDGGLLRTRRGAASRVPAFLEDYALLASGLLALHRATGEERWLDEARSLVEEATRRFRDASNGGGYFATLPSRSDLFVRARSVEDGAVPGGTSVMLHNLLDLHEATGERRWLEQLEGDLASISGSLAEHPLGAALATAAVHRVAEAHPELLPRSEDAPATGPAAVAIAVEPSGLVPSSPGQAIEATITLVIAEGFHINAHEPSEAGLVRLSVTATDGSGVAVEVRYPEGGVHHGAPSTLAGTVRIGVTIRRTGPVDERAALVVRCQPCTATACLAPVVRSIPLAPR